MLDGETIDYIEADEGAAPEEEEYYRQHLSRKNYKRFCTREENITTRTT